MLFAVLTTLLAKEGLHGVDSNLATALRTSVVLVMAVVLVVVAGERAAIRLLTRRGLRFLVLSGLATGASWLCFFRALQDGPVSIVLPVDKLSLLFASGFAYLVLREQVSRREVAGMAVILLTEAARQGHVPAQRRLGALFLEGWGVEADEPEAAYWLEKAAERGDTEAVARLGILLLNARQMRTDPVKAVDLLRQAAQAGNALAQFHLGLCLLEGRGVPQDSAQGMTLVRQSARLGHDDAKTYLRELPP